ncbi:MAG TPA: hypothetical protein VFH50_09420 [Acidimicrobiales bacterium]|nr:hypothetical protein [Acidimicrobiales bacterium]
MRRRSSFGASGRGRHFTREEVIDALYRGLLDRPVEAPGLRHHLELLDRGNGLDSVVYGIGHSREYFETWLRAGDLPALVANVWRSRDEHRDEPPIFLLHIMKTGGTALAETLRAVAGNRFCLTQVFLDHVVALPSVVLEQSSLVAGHLGIEGLDLLPKGTVAATVIRDPVERVLSHYAHVLADPALGAETEGLSLDEFVHAPRWRPYCQDFQARSLVHRIGLDSVWRDGSPEDRLAALPAEARPAAPRLPLQNVFELEPMELSGDALRIAALESLDGIEVVGVSDALDDVLARLARIWSVVETPAVPRLNVSARRLAQPEVPPSLRVAIIEANSVDLALYEQARSRAGELARSPTRSGAERPGTETSADARPAAAAAGTDAGGGADGPVSGRVPSLRSRLLATALRGSPPRWPLALALLATVAVAVVDNFFAHRIVLIGLLVLGPCCALVGRRWRATALIGALSALLAGVSGVTDGLWGTASYTLFLATVTIVAVAATVGTALIEHAGPAELRLSPATPSREPADLLR